VEEACRARQHAVSSLTFEMWEMLFDN